MTEEIKVVSLVMVPLERLGYNEIKQRDGGEDVPW